MIRSALRLALCAIVACGLWWFARQVKARADLEAELRVSRAELVGARTALSQAQEAARVHRVYLERAERDRERWTALEHELQTMEGRDAPLSDLLRATAGRLYGP
ncbi:hypothetical protein [Salipiger sp. PrR002]|uniref:hypothetical protein n=1 Tax=Salipiger sp. PrR002 TaxID=2706489 RepID=UPI0013B84140|nr:hypothetical protein [Salipiger sp. PrR002]NDW00050.1 hypothetical protein [Salipiger sp. PrR002]NDW56942.1 hypothetical protein [Salipiger sp. PrR004]